jgi:hypothetical protein
MAGKRKAPLWRRVFLRALARTGNISVSAAEAGIEPETVHRHRCKDELFALRCAAALAKGKANAEKPRARRRARGAGELVLRRTAKGARLVRATPGRWNARAEDAFFADLAVTGCVQSAVAASGLSVAALYYRRNHYPEFAARWAAVEAVAAARLPALLHAASIASLDPAVEGSGLPRVNVDQAIRISQMKGRANGVGAQGRDWDGKLTASEKELDEEILRKLEVLHQRQIREGWIETGEGALIPPGWVYVGPRAAKAKRPAKRAVADGGAIG